MRQLLGTETIYYLFYRWNLLLSFCFLSNQDNLYMIHQDSDLFYDIFNTIIEHNKKQTHYPSSILNYFDIYFLSASRGSSIISSASSLIMVSMLSLFECIARSSSLSMEEIKLFSIVN